MNDTDAPGRRPLRRLLRWVAAVAALLVVVFYAGGGWYFSGRIRSDVLDVKPYPVQRSLTLTSLGSGTVRIASTDPAEMKMLRGPTAYGVKWRGGGYGQVSGPVVSSTGSHVVRRFAVVTGSAPADGTRAELDLAAFPADPTYAFGKGVQEVTYTSPLGRFAAYDVPPAGADQGRWAILVHGKGGSRAEMYRMGRSTVKAGWRTLDITYRNDEGFPRDPSGYYQYGRTEWRDLQAAVAYAGAHGAPQIVLGADSMGGGIVASYLRHRTDKATAPPIVGVVLDAPMLDLSATVEYGARQISLPLIGPVPDSLTSVATELASWRFDIDWAEVDYLRDDSWLTVPALVFHGEGDTTVPIATSKRLVRDDFKNASLIAFGGVEHVRMWNADPADYDRRVEMFLAPLSR